MKKIVITGGPCAGKSTIINTLQKHLYNITIVPEAATLLLSNGWPPPIDKTDIKWFKGFQKAVLDTQLHLENALNFTTYDLALCDRGRLDCAAYWPDGAIDFYETFDIILMDEYHRYEAVIFIDSVAVHKPHLYNTDNNPERYDTLIEAQKINDKLYNVWKHHKNFLHIENIKTIDDNINLASKFINELK